MSFSTNGQKAFMEALSKELPGLHLTVTSWGRSSGEQAAAMLSKLSREGAKGLYDLYHDDELIKQLLALPHTQSAWESFIGIHGPSLSKHLSGGAVDLRTRDLSAGQESQVKAAIKKLGGRTIAESDHLHVDLPLQYQAGAMALAAGSAVAGAATSHPLVTVGLLAGAGGAIWWLRKRR